MKPPSYSIFVIIFLLTTQSEFNSYVAADRLFENKESDIQFILKNGEKVDGHKAVFGAASPKFNSIVYGGDKNDKMDKRKIKIANVEPEAFKIMTDFIYSNKLELDSMSQALDVYEASNTYELENLKTLTKKYMNVNIKTDNVLDVLEFSKLYNLSETTNLCRALIQNDTINILKTEKFLNSGVESLEALVNEDQLNIEEVDLFEFIELWARHHSYMKGTSLNEIRPLMENIIHRVRFLLMSAEEFVTSPTRSKLLTDNQKLIILMNINVPRRAALPNGFSDSTKSRTSTHLFTSRHTEVSVKWTKQDILKTELDKRYTSPLFYLNNYQFYLGLDPTLGCGTKVLGIYLFCSKKGISESACLKKVKYTFNLIRENGEPSTQSIEYTFSTDIGYGWGNFIKWEELIDGGYIKNGSVVVEAVVRVEE